MGDVDVADLFRRAVAEDDAAAMREGLERMLGLADGGGLSPELEYELRRPDFVMEMPQSGERIRGRDDMRRMQESFPGGGPRSPCAGSSVPGGCGWPRPTDGTARTTGRW